MPSGSGLIVQGELVVALIELDGHGVVARADKVLLNLFVCAHDGGGNGDDGRDADNHAQHGQRTAQLVAPDPVKGHAKMLCHPPYPPFTAMSASAPSGIRTGAPLQLFLAVGERDIVLKRQVRRQNLNIVVHGPARRDPLPDEHAVARGHDVAFAVCSRTIGAVQKQAAAVHAVRNHAQLHALPVFELDVRVLHAHCDDVPGAVPVAAVVVSGYGNIADPR